MPTAVAPENHPPRLDDLPNDRCRLAIVLLKMLLPNKDGLPRPTVLVRMNSALAVAAYDLRDCGRAITSRPTPFPNGENYFEVRLRERGNA